MNFTRNFSGHKSLFLCSFLGTGACIATPPSVYSTPPAPAPSRQIWPAPVMWSTRTSTTWRGSARTCTHEDHWGSWGLPRYGVAVPEPAPVRITEAPEDFHDMAWQCQNLHPWGSLRLLRTSTIWRGSARTCTREDHWGSWGLPRHGVAVPAWCQKGWYYYRPE